MAAAGCAKNSRRNSLPNRSPRYMSIDWLRQFCLALPHTTEQIQWQDVLVFKVGAIAAPKSRSRKAAAKQKGLKKNSTPAGKMFATAALEAHGQWLALKCTPEEFAELTERRGIIPAPYLARASWIAIESETTLRRSEVETLLRRSHELVFAKLPKSQQEKLQSFEQRKLAGPCKRTRNGKHR
jgi:predicted DNA-binding protein (MmcQ/YjbR family)